MATLYFKIGADYENVIRLRDEIKKLENQLRNFGKSTPETQIRQTEERLATTRQEFVRLTTEAAKAGAVMESDLKRKINSVTKASDELSEEIIKQRKIIRDTQDDVRRLSEQYSKMGKFDPKATSTLNQLNRAKAALNEQKYALGDLQDQQARNRLELRRLTREYRDFSQGTDKATVTVDALMSSLKRTAAEIGGLAAIKKFGTDVIDATGKMQQLQVALSTILQSKSKADALLAEVTEFARKTPFNLDDVANGAKQLLAYGSSAETVVDELSMLGDVASGLQIPLSSLIYLYGTLRVQGRAYWRDIQQFQGRGVNVVEEMAKNLGVTQDQIKKLVEEGKIGFKDVEKAFQSMTSEGGKFNNMLENAAGTWPQRIANLEDTLFTKLVDFGNKYKEVFEFGIGTAEELVEHLDDVISVIGGLVAAYGTYKAALIATAVAQKAVGFVESIRLIMSYRKQLGLATAAQQAFNLAAKSNVYVALLSVLVGLGTAVYMFTKRTNEATAAQEALSKVNKKADEEFSSQAATIDRLNGVLKSETASLDQKKKALGELQAVVPNYHASLNKEGELINNNTEAIKAYLTQLEKQIKLKAAQEELEELYRKKRQQEKQKQTATENYNKAQSLYNSSSTLTASALQRRGINTGVAVFAQNNAVNNQLKDNANKAKKKLDDINSKLGETLSGIAAIEKEIEQTSLSDKKDMSQSSISKELENVTKRIKTLKQEIAGLRSGKLQAEAGKTVESAIKAKEKELKTANETLETLTGNKPKTEKQLQYQQKLSDELLELRRRNQKAETDLMEEGTQKKLKRIDDDYEAQKAEIEKKAQELAELNKKTGASGAAGGGLTSEQQSAIDEALRLNEEERAKAVSEVYEAEAEAMREYLRQYGTFQQQKLAIAEEYAEKIRKAQTEGERLSLEKERDAAVNKVEMESVSQQVDWGSVFGNFGVMFKEQIRPTIERLEEIARSDEFQSSGLEEKEILYSLISGLRQSETLWDGDIFREISEDLAAYRSAMNAYMEAQQRETAATRRLAEAKERLKAAEESGDSEERDAAQLAVDEASANLGKASKDVQRFGSQVQQTTSGLQEAAERAANMFGGLESGLQGLSSGSLKGIGQGVMQLDKLFSGGKLTEKLGTSLAGGFQKLFGNSKVTEALTKGLGNAGLAGSIISAVLGMLDTIAEEGVSGIVSGLIDTVFGAVNSILKDALSFNMVEKVGGSLIDGLKGTLDTITFGGFSSWLNLGGNDKEVQETIDRLTESNEYLRQSIDGLAERINQSDTTNEQSVDYYNRARQSQLDWEETQREIIKEAASAWTNSGYGFLGMGGKGSFNAHAPGSGWEGWDAFTETLRKNGFNITVSGTEQLWELTPEQMKLLRDSNPSEWQQLFSGDGHRNPKEYVDEYIEAAGTLEELTDSLNEKLTGYNWSGFLDQYKSLLKNMESSTEDFADFINETISNALIEAFVNEQLQDDIKELYQYMADHAADGLSDTEIDAIRRMNEEIADKSIEWRQRMAEAGLIGESSSAGQQTATSKGFETMTQDQASELSGRFTAVAESNYRIEGKITELSGSISTMMVSVTGMYNIADETRSILANSYLELQEINENTGNSAKYLKDIKADIAIVKQNTSRI